MGKSIDLAFITNTRGTPSDKQVVYGSFPGWELPRFNPPDIFDWKQVDVVINDTTINSMMIVIGSDTHDLYAGLAVQHRGNHDALKNAMRKLRLGRKQVAMAIEHAINDLGVKVVAFGASTKNLLKVDAIRKIPGYDRVLYANGDNYTAAVCIEQLKQAAQRAEIDLFDPRTNVVIVGAYGLIGRLLAKHFSTYSCNLLLVGRDLSRLRDLTSLLDRECNYEVFTDCRDIGQSVNVLVTATNSPESIITPDLLRRWGSHMIALDVAEPPNIKVDVSTAMGGEFLRIDGGIVCNQGLHFANGNQMGLRHKTIFACYGEGFATTLRALHGMNGYGTFDLMSVDARRFDDLVQAAENCGFYVDDFQNYAKPISDKEWELFRSCN
ncbi:MAG: hypothetical protein ABH884_00200 [Candidatus Komeilibacteria bacterium]